MNRGTNVLAATALTFVVAAQCAPPAVAAGPPPVDGTLLPPPAAPAPPEATRQQEPCTVALEPASGADPVTQLKGIDIDAVWRMSRGAGQRIAVIDTGVQPLRGLPTVVPGGDYVSTGDGRQDCDGHGTIVAGIIAAAPDAGRVPGLAPDATLISIRQSSLKFGAVADPANPGFGDVGTLAMAVRTAADMGASVINISSVACTEAVLDDRPLGAALAYAVDVKDSVVVGAAGNVGGPGQCPSQNTAGQPSVVVSPAWYDDYVLAVGSVNAEGTPSSFSLRSPWVDVAAPGEDVASLGSTGPSSLSGTSYAAPVVSALAALVRSRFPRLSARQVMKRIATTARNSAGERDPATGYGVVDVMAALSDQSAGSAPAVRKPVAMEPVSTDKPDDAAARPRAVAATGAAVCLAAAVMLGAAARLRRRPTGADDVPGDQRGLTAEFGPGGQ